MKLDADAPRQVTLIGVADDRFMGVTQDGERVLANLNGKTAKARKVLTSVQNLGGQLVMTVSPADLVKTG
jgi:hypothetical protein